MVSYRKLVDSIVICAKVCSPPSKHAMTRSRRLIVRRMQKALTAVESSRSLILLASEFTARVVYMRDFAKAQRNSVKECHRILEKVSQGVKSGVVARNTVITILILSVFPSSLLTTLKIVAGLMEVCRKGSVAFFTEHAHSTPWQWSNKYH